MTYLQACLANPGAANPTTIRPGGLSYLTSFLTSRPEKRLDEITREETRLRLRRRLLENIVRIESLRRTKRN